MCASYKLVWVLAFLRLPFTTPLLIFYVPPPPPNRHTFKVNKALLLALYNHTLEVKVWNSINKVSARAKYDRPKAFRLPALAKSTQPVKEEAASPDVLSGERPQWFPLVHHQTRRSRGNRRSHRATSPLSGDVEEEEGEEGRGEEGRGEGEEKEEKEKENDVRAVDAVVSTALVPTGSDPNSSPPCEEVGVAVVPSSLALQGLSRRQQKQLEAEATEKRRLEREGVATLRLRLSDLFAKTTSISTKVRLQPTKV